MSGTDAEIQITEQMIRDDFEDQLKLARAGQFSSEVLIDWPTQKILRELVKIYPRYDIDIVAKARRQLELQIKSMR